MKKLETKKTSTTMLNTIEQFEASDVLRGCCSQGCCR